MTPSNPTYTHPPKWNGATYAQHRDRKCRCRRIRYGARMRSACRVPGTDESAMMTQLARTTAALIPERTRTALAVTR